MTSSAPIVETGVAELGRLLRAGELTVPELVGACLERIEALDRQGPQLRAVIETSAQAMQLAEQLQQELLRGEDRGPLHGIPVLLKDNIATADGMQNTAGSWALDGALPLHDAGLVPALREAGAVILGKANLTEWSNFRSPRAQGGWSGRGGQCRNPYSLDRRVAGSSSGPAAAVAASYVPLAVGTETDGSIINPASVNGVVGLKPTVGLVSRRGIIPISSHQDSAGPMARSVADAATLLTALSREPDPDDLRAQTAATQPGRPSLPHRPAEAAAGVDYFANLDPEALRGARLGVLRDACGDPDSTAIFERALETLREAGAEIVDPIEIPGYDWITEHRAEQLPAWFTEMREGFAAYAEQFIAPGFPVRTMADVVEFNRAHADIEMPVFEQEFLESTAAAASLEDPSYAQLMHSFQQAARRGLDEAFAEHRLDAIIAPTTGPAGPMDQPPVKRSKVNVSTISAISGYPVLSINAGYFSGMPVGLSFTGSAWTEQRLLDLAHAFELRGLRREPPGYAEAFGTP